MQAVMHTCFVLQFDKKAELIYLKKYNLTPPGVKTGVCGVGVACDGVECEGVACEGVACDGVGVAAAGVAPGVSSHRDRRFVPGVGVSWIVSTPTPRSVRGVSAHPLLWPGVSINFKFQLESGLIKFITISRVRKIYFYGDLCML